MIQSIVVAGTLPRKARGGVLTTIGPRSHWMSGQPQPPESADLQFDRAEFLDAAPASAPCARCKGPLLGTYFTAGESVLCATCAAQAGSELTGGSSAGRVFRAMLFGGVAGALGAGIYYGVAALTGYEIGLVVLAVGILVGVAVRIGSRGRGGLFYQFLAVFLTYAAIGASYFITLIRELSRHPELAASAPADETAASVPAALAFVFVAGFILALPVLSSMESPLGFIIIGFALFEAWRINRGRAIELRGPFAVGPPAPRTAAAAPPSLPPLPESPDG
jgi:hypothetical protein